MLILCHQLLENNVPVTLTATSPYVSKDQRKANIATKFIGRGSPASSTAQYAKDFGALANCGRYTKDDLVFVSVEGNRRGRMSLDTKEIDKGIAARVIFIADNQYNRSRPYNIGEQELMSYLMQAGYKNFEFRDYTEWRPA